MKKLLKAFRNPTLKIKIVLFFLTLNFTLSSQENSESNLIDSILITEVKSADQFFEISARTRKLKEYLTGDGWHISKSSCLNLVESFPALHDYAKHNFLRDMCYVKCIFNCYNHYISQKVKPIVNENYFNSFGLNSNKDRRSGPTHELLVEKQLIDYSLTLVTITDSKGNTHQKYRGYFRLPNSGFYPIGFLGKNLKKVVKGDKDAMHYINKYCAIYFTKTFLILVSIPLIGLGLNELAEIKPIFEFEHPELMGFSMLIGGGLTSLTAKVIGKSYKLNNAQNAIEAYNKNLETEKKTKALFKGN